VAKIKDGTVSSGLRVGSRWFKLSWLWCSFRGRPISTPKEDLIYVDTLLSKFDVERAMPYEV
jgi:hypothetical protein